MEFFGEFQLPSLLPDDVVLGVELEGPIEEFEGRRLIVLLNCDGGEGCERFGRFGEQSSSLFEVGFGFFEAVLSDEGLAKAEVEVPIIGGVG